LVHDLEGSVLLEPLEPQGLPARPVPATKVRHRRRWPLGALVLVLVAFVSAVSVTTRLRAEEFDRLERQWIQVQLRSRARIDTETVLLRSVDTAPDRAVDSALIDTYGNEINFVEQLDRELKGELIVDHGLRVLRGAMRRAVDLHLSELQAVESFYWAPGPPSQRPPEASRDFLVQSAEVSRQVAEQRRRLGRH
jgi:hypothetical protein